jgi:hypothetical protein
LIFASLPVFHPQWRLAESQDGLRELFEKAVETVGSAWSGNAQWLPELAMEVSSWENHMKIWENHWKNL